MLGRIISVRCLVGSESHNFILRHANALVTRRNNSTLAEPQAVPEEWGKARPYEDIPGPKPLPLIGNGWRFFPFVGDLHGKGFVGMIDHFYENYGYIMKLSGIPGRDDMVFVYDPDEIEKVFRNEGPWPIRDAVRAAVYYRNEYRKEYFQGVGGLVTVQGEEWQKFRSKVNQIMMQPRSTKLYISPIDTVANDFIERIRYLRDNNQEMPANFNNEMYKWALESIAYVALDTRLGCLDKDLLPDSEPQKMIDSVQMQFEAMYQLEFGMPFWKYFSTPAWNKLVKSSDYFKDVSMKYINQAMERLKNMPEDSDRELTVLEKLLARDPDPKVAMIMALDMLAAGIDTTGYSSVIAMYYLAKNPDKQEKLFEEIKRILPNKDSPITSDVLNELKYLKACIKESMRISPIAVGNQRVTVKDMVIADYQIPKGTSIMMPLIKLSNMDKYFPEAKKFIPERWIKGEPQASTKAHSFITLPFGYGPRMCIGRRFAELEIETLVTKVIRNFRLEYNYGDFKFVSRLLYTPISPLKFKMVDREN